MKIKTQYTESLITSRLGEAMKKLRKRRERRGIANHLISFDHHGAMKQLDQRVYVLTCFDYLLGSCTLRPTGSSLECWTSLVCTVHSAMSLKVWLPTGPRTGRLNNKARHLQRARSTCKYGGVKAAAALFFACRESGWKLTSWIILGTTLRWAGEYPP